MNNQAPEFEVGYQPHFEVADWGSAARITAGAAGLAILALGRRTQGVPRQLSTFAGISLCLRALLNKDLTQAIGTLLSPTIRLRRQVIIDAPPEQVAAFWTHPENYPRFMSFVRKVDLSRFGNLIWEIEGPGGMSIRWETFVLSWPPSATIAWRTVPGSPIFNSGQVTIEALGVDRSQVRIEFTYALRAGRLGYAAARVLGFDPRHSFDADLAKMKSLIEEQWSAMQDSTLPLS